MHPVYVNAEPMSQYVEHICKFFFIFLHFPVPLSSIGSFASANNMSINVYSVDDYPLRMLNVMVYNTIPPLGTLAD